MITPLLPRISLKMVMSASVRREKGSSREEEEEVDSDVDAAEVESEREQERSKNSIDLPPLPWAPPVSF